MLPGAGQLCEGACLALPPTHSLAAGRSDWQRPPYRWRLSHLPHPVLCPRRDHGPLVLCCGCAHSTGAGVRTRHRPANRCVRAWARASPNTCSGPHQGTLQRGAGTSSRAVASAGGAQDVGSFRENIRQGYLPLPTDMTFEGLISQYYFDTSR